MKLDKKQSLGELNKRYQEALRRIRKKRYARVGFFIAYESVFSFSTLYEMMLKDKKFKPFIVVIPDILHSTDGGYIRMEEVYNKLKSRYENVYISYDKESGEYKDYAELCDIVCIDNQYDCLTYDYYKIEYLAQKGIPTFYTSYGYTVSKWSSSCLKSEEELKKLWKLFLLDEFDMETYEGSEDNKGNAMVIGYPKMDGLQKVEERERERKKIMICPHHTILEDADISLSNFLKYYEFFLELPELYPDIDFVFRPHPLLKEQLIINGVWSEAEVDEYFEKISQKENVEYQDGGEYFDTFVNSDAMIHDCGSYCAEYLYTGHPVMFMMKDEQTNEKNCNEFAKICIKYHYQAQEQQDICRFIDEVVIKGNDYMREERTKFFDEKVCFSYPNSTKKVLGYLKKEIFGFSFLDFLKKI